MIIQIIEGKDKDESYGDIRNVKFKVEYFNKYMMIHNYLTINNNSFSGEVVYIGTKMTMLEIQKYVEEILGHELDPLIILEEIELQEI